MRNILFVDDCLELLELFSSIVNKHGYGCVTASSKKELFLCLKKDMPDIILLDVVLSEEDGRGICKEIKSHDTYSHIPVILMSASSEKLKYPEEVLADEILEKPFTMELVIGKINALATVPGRELLASAE